MIDDFLRFYIDPDTGEPHIFGHQISEEEVIEILNAVRQRLHARGGAYMKQGVTQAGRYLCVIYREDEDGLFVITAYDLTPKGRKAVRRRKRRRP